MTEAINNLSAKAAQLPQKEPFKVSYQTEKHLLFTGTTFSWKMPNGDTREVIARNQAKQSYYSVLTAFNKYSTEESPEINATELKQLREELGKFLLPQNMGEKFGEFISSVFSNKPYTNSQVYNGFNNLFDKYSRENTDGGKDITPAEQAEIIDILSTHICVNDKYNIKATN